MIFLRYDGKSCQEGVDLRALTHTIRAIRQAHPGRSISHIKGWVVLQWDPHAGAGCIKVPGEPAIEVADLDRPPGSHLPQVFFLRAPCSIMLMPASPAGEAVQVSVDANGHLVDCEPAHARPSMG